MKEFTAFSSFSAMLEASPFDVASEDDFKAIPEDEWDRYVRTATTFSSWSEMQKEAGLQWVKRQLLKGL